MYIHASVVNVIENMIRSLPSCASAISVVQIAPKKTIAATKKYWSVPRPCERRMFIANK